MADNSAENSGSVRHTALNSMPLQPPKRPTTVAGRKLAPKQRIAMTAHMRNYLMDRFLICKREGLMNIERPAELRHVWTRVCTEMKQGYPEYIWTESKIQTEYKMCRKRWRQWLTLLDRSGNGPDEEGRMQASEACWEWFLTKVPDGRWMRTEALGSSEVYGEVFEKETAIGRYIAEAGDEDGIPSMEADPNDAIVTPTPTKKIPPRKRRFDPDLNSILSDTSDSEASTTPIRSQNKRQQRFPPNIETEIAAINKVSTTMARVAGSDDITAAIQLIEDRLHDLLGPDKIQAYRVVTSSAFNAVALQNIKDDEDKVAFLRSLFQ